MDSNKLKSIIESLLFVSGEPLKIKKLASVAQASSSEVKEAVNSLREDLKNSKRGLQIIEKDDEVQMATSAENSQIVDQFLKSEMEQSLSRASLETLAIVAYRGPLTRSQIEEIRGVNCTFTLRYLLLRGLIERIENPNDSRSWYYQISFDFLKKLNLNRKEDLPRYEELKKVEEKPASVAAEKQIL